MKKDGGECPKGGNHTWVATDIKGTKKCSKCGKLMRTLPEYRPQWTVRRGMEQLRDAFERHGLTSDEFLGDSFFRIKRILALQAAGRIDESLRWTAAPRMVRVETGA